MIDDVRLMCIVCREFDENCEIENAFQFLDDTCAVRPLNSIEFACISIGDVWFLRRLTFASHRWNSADSGQDQELDASVGSM